MYKIRGRITPLAFYDGCDCEARVAFFADGNYYLWFPGAGALFRWNAPPKFFPSHDDFLRSYFQSDKVDDGVCGVPETIHAMGR
jgi:hypothetical protein